MTNSKKMQELIEKHKKEKALLQKKEEAIIQKNKLKAFNAILFLLKNNEFKNRFFLLIMDTGGNATADNDKNQKAIDDILSILSNLGIEKQIKG